MKRILTTLSQKWPEYLLEIIVITVGILGAFALNNWNDGRKDRIQEQIVLKQLKKEFETNLEQLESKIGMRKNIAQNASELLDHIDFQTEVSRDIIIRKMASVILTPSYDPIVNDVLRSDKIHIITNDRLRHLLASWPSELEDLKTQESGWLKFYANSFEPFLMDSGIMRDINFSFYENVNNLTYLKDKSVAENMNLRKSKKTFPIEELLNSPKLEGLLSNAQTYSVDINWESETTKSEIEEILVLIDQEIK